MKFASYSTLVSLLAVPVVISVPLDSRNASSASHPHRPGSNSTAPHRKIKAFPPSVAFARAAHATPSHTSNSTTDDPPAGNSSTSGAAFAADPSINVAGIYAAAQAAKASPLPSGSYPTTPDANAAQVQIYGDWLALGSGGGTPQSNSTSTTGKNSTNTPGDQDGDLDSRAAAGGVAAFHFIADMDTDCDGPDVRIFLSILQDFMLTAPAG